MKAIAKTQPGIGIDTIDVPYPQLSTNSVIIKTIACGICGADLEVYMGRLSKFGTLPMILGHEFTGEIVEIGEQVEGYNLKDQVVVQPFTGMCGNCYYCTTGQPWSCSSRRMLGGLAEYVAVPANNLYRIPSNISAYEATLCDPFAVAAHALHISGFRLLDTAVVLGPGPIGLMTSMALKHAGASLIIVTGTNSDVSPRLELASRFADTIINIDAEDPVPKVNELTSGLGVDIVFDTTGSQQAGPQGIHMLKTKGKLVVIGHYPKNMALADPSYKGYSIIGNVSYNWDTWERLIPYLTQRSVDLGQFISHKLPFEDATAGFELARSKKSLKVLLVP